MIATVLQWIGFAGIVYGYFVFGENQARGAACSMIGAFALTAWCALQPTMPWGVLTLQLTFVGINTRYLWQCWVAVRAVGLIAEGELSADRQARRNVN